MESYIDLSIIIYKGIIMLEIPFNELGYFMPGCRVNHRERRSKYFQAEESGQYSIITIRQSS